MIIYFSVVIVYVMILYDDETLSIFIDDFDDNI
jgi:hypothetical protein